jgi:hypothetical protein
MSEADDGILSNAIARNAAAVLSLPSAGMLRHHKTRFLAETPEGFWVESAAGDRALIDDVIASVQPAGISFRGGIHRVAFTAPLLNATRYSASMPPPPSRRSWSRSRQTSRRFSGATTIVFASLPRAS